MIKVLFFASLREQLGCDGTEAEAGGVTNIAELRAKLSENGEAWKSALTDERLQVALNQQLSTLDANVADGDEVAFFPPVTGG
ncbi:molybdopterin converting factor subunit 1 [Microbulbifer bruguierae]|uniref:Molybdopterin synthase sulfur carrier subunit n=1 Tax=Microbulbifer bruguierae TaxID=3029061 RepID=A0ABY8NBN0_9GAMM|nr:molybdopterin converting factor subunit 1 [Microbulbifer bruguierae]WGL16326.1 molybdopterin converting factor subunit 1 [Microbulbifer bruguierae]